MILSFKDREIPWGKRVKVYRNLNAGTTEKIFSIKHGDLVFAHGHSFILKDCDLIVKEKGRQRVIREKRKNVHAYIEGTLCKDQPMVLLLDQITYNPYKHGYFYKSSDNMPVYRCDFVQFEKNGKVYI